MNASKRVPLSKLKKYTDKLWSLKIKQHDRMCQRCGSLRNLESAHVFARTHGSVRFELDNGVCLCKRCHALAHAREDRFHAFIIKRIGMKRYDELRIQSQQITKPDRQFYEDKIKELKE